MRKLIPRETDDIIDFKEWLFYYGLTLTLDVFKLGKDHQSLLE